MKPGQKLAVPRGNWAATGVKFCRQCSTEKEISQFYTSSGRPAGYCNPCRVENQREARAKNHAKFRETERRSKLRVAYGISTEDYDRMLATQDSCCAICGSKNSGSRVYKFTGKTKRFSVDHCHTTGKVRGLLCTRCNRALGLVDGNVDTLMKMISYLRKNFN